MCEVRAALKLIEDFVKTHPDELDRVVIYGVESCLSGYVDAMNLMVPLRKGGIDSSFMGSSKESQWYSWSVTPGIHIP